MYNNTALSHFIVDLERESRFVRGNDSIRPRPYYVFLRKDKSVSLEVARCSINERLKNELKPWRAEIERCFQTMVKFARFFYHLLGNEGAIHKGHPIWSR